MIPKIRNSLFWWELIKSWVALEGARNKSDEKKDLITFEIAELQKQNYHWIPEEWMNYTQQLIDLLAWGNTINSYQRITK